MISEIQRFRTITISGSSKFIEIMAVVAWILESEEECKCYSLNFLPWWYDSVTSSHFAEEVGKAKLLDNIHLDKILNSDEVFVIDYRGYIGESTSSEIIFAKKNGKKIRYWSKECEIKDRVEKMLPGALLNKIGTLNKTS